jgi:hypothetical protein
VYTLIDQERSRAMQKLHRKQAPHPHEHHPPSVEPKLAADGADGAGGPEHEALAQAMRAIDSVTKSEVAELRCPRVATWKSIS